MSKVVAGTFPNKVSYVYSDAKDVNVGCAWDMSWSKEDPPNITLNVRPTFPIMSGDEVAKTKAITWAERGFYDYEAQKHIKHTSNIDEFDNKPIKQVKVLSLEERGNGGRAYKVLIDNKYYIDMREDVMMDTMLKSGISPGGILNGEFIWAKITGNMKLIRIGSELHRLVTEFDSKKEIKPVGKRALEIGGVYRDIRKSKAIFLGYINTTALKGPPSPAYWERRDKKPTFTYEKKFIKKAMLFYDMWQDNFDEAIKDLKLKGKETSWKYRFVIKTSHKYIEKVDDVEVPDELMENLRAKNLKEVKQMTVDFSTQVSSKKNVAPPDGWYLEETIASNSKFINMYPFQGKEVEPFDVKALLLFS